MFPVCRGLHGLAGYSSRSEEGRRPSERSEVYKFVAWGLGALGAVKSRSAHIYFDGVRTVA